MEPTKSASQINRERILETAFGWLRDVSVMEVDGKKLMVNKDDNKPYNVADVITEEEFIRTWLIQFALGNRHGRNYFSTSEWIELSGDGLQSVMVVDKDNKPLFLVPPLVTTNMGPEHQKMLRNLEHAIKQIAADEQMKHMPDASAHLAHHVSDGLSSVKPKTFTDMVPQWFYAKCGIIPEVEQQIYYIAGVVNTSCTMEQMNEARPILYKAYKKENVTAEEKKFIHELTLGQFTFDPATNDTAVKQNDVDNKPEQAADYDPLEC